jgi:hypothetical protein
MPDLHHVHMARLPVIEIGESVRPAVYPIDPDGRVLSDRFELAVESGNPSLLSVENGVITGLREGETTLRVQLQGCGQAAETEQAIRIVAPGSPRFALRDSRRPRLLFNADELGAFLERVSEANADIGGSAISFRKTWLDLLQKADEYAAETVFEVRYPSVATVVTVQLPLVQPIPFPEPPGYIDYPFWTMYSRAIEERLVLLSAAYLTTGKERYGAKIREYMLALAGYSRWYEFDHRGAEGNLSNAHFTIGISTAYDAVWHALSPGERAVVRGAILEKGLRPLAVDFGNCDQHNIVAAKQVAMMFGALSILDEEPYARKYVNQAFDYLAAYLDRKMSTHETEGLMYNNVAARHVLMAADVLRRATGNEVLSGHEYLKRQLPDLYFYFLAPGGDNTFPNFSDSYLKLDLAYMMSMLASHNGNPVAMWYVEKFEGGKPSVLLNLRSTVKPIPPDDYYGEAKSAVFPAIGWAALRNGWGEQDHLLGFTSSPSDRGHNHKDQNNVMVNVAGEWLLTNPGYQDYVPGPRADYTTGTIGHNSLLIDDQGQEVLGGGRISGWFLGGAFQFVSGDATESYKDLLQGYERTVWHIGHAYYIVIDRVRAGTPGRKAELLFHTTSDIVCGDRILCPGMPVTERNVKIRGKRSALGLHFAYPPQAEIDVRDYKGAEQYGPHLSVRAKEADRHAEQWFATVLEPLPSPQQQLVLACEAVLDSDTLCVEVKRSRVTDWLALRKSGGSSGQANRARDMLFCGRQAWLSQCAGEKLFEACALVEGTMLAAHGQTLLEADHEVSVTVRRLETSIELCISAERASRIRLHLPDYREKEADGICAYDKAGQMLEVAVTSGEHRFRLQRS